MSQTMVTKPDILTYFEYDSKIPLESKTKKGELKVKMQEMAIAGETKIKLLMVKNNHKLPIELIPYSLDGNLSVTRFPPFLAPNQSGVVELQYHIPKDSTEPPSGASFGFDIIALANDNEGEND